jgi:hypothetical protein
MNEIQEEGDQEKENDPDSPYEPGDDLYEPERSEVAALEAQFNRKEKIEKIVLN